MTPMRVAPEAMAEIERALAEYLKQPIFGDAAFAKRNQALPLYAGWTGTTYLTTSGEFWYRNHEYDPPRIEHDLNTGSKLVALVLAAERFPALMRLLPTRPPDAVDCGDCGGRGQITVGAVSNIICGQCSALGWRLPHNRKDAEGGAYPTFEDALAKFRRFASDHGLPTNLAFVTGDEALLIGDQLYVSVQAFASDADARAAYERAVARRFGVAIGAVGELPDGRLAAYVYAPTTEREAERLMYPNGLKMTLPERGVAVRVASPLRMSFLRLRYASRVAERTREYFR
jgi:hypothetical protein